MLSIFCSNEFCVDCCSAIRETTNRNKRSSKMKQEKKNWKITYDLYSNKFVIEIGNEQLEISRNYLEKVRATEALKFSEHVIREEKNKTGAA